MYYLQVGRVVGYPCAVSPCINMGADHTAHRLIIRLFVRGVESSGEQADQNFAVCESADGVTPLRQSADR